MELKYKASDYYEDIYPLVLDNVRFSDFMLVMLGKNSLTAKNVVKFFAENNVNLSLHEVNDWLNGETLPNKEQAEILAKYFNMSVLFIKVMCWM